MTARSAIGSVGDPSAMQGREFAWTNADFDRVQDLIYRRAGISLHDGKHAMVYSRLSRRLRDTGHQSFKAYLSWLEATEATPRDSPPQGRSPNLRKGARSRGQPHRHRRQLIPQLLLLLVQYHNQLLIHLLILELV